MKRRPLDESGEPEADGAAAAEPVPDQPRLGAAERKRRRRRRRMALAASRNANDSDAVQNAEAQDAGADASPPAPAAARTDVAKARGRRAAAFAEAMVEKAPIEDAEARPSIVLEAVDADAMKRMRRRQARQRFAAWASFALIALIPSGIAAWYLNVKAADQYASNVSFAVRSLDGGAAAPLLEIFGGSTESTVSDSQMLFEYIQSQPLVKTIDQQLDLRVIYNRPEADEFFALGEDRTVEQLVEYWNRAVTVAYDSAGGIIHVEAKAFRAEDAQAVTKAVLAESERLINELSVGARSDAVRFAEVDLEGAEGRVREARLALQAIRSSPGTADISGDITQEMGIIAGLRTERAGLQADYDSRAAKLGPESPVLAALKRRIESLSAQIAEAESRIAADSPETAGGRATLTEAAGEQERLMVELEFATNMYTHAQTALESARADARRAQRYLATHIAPTLSQEAEYPYRIGWSAAIFVVLTMAWSVLMLIVGSIRDRN